MPIRVRCPRCWETAELPNDALGKRGVCNSCGAQVMIPAKLSKSCFICGADVTRVKHTKDEDGNYLCMGCYESRNPLQQASFSVSTLECSICRKPFDEGEGTTRDGQPVCAQCAATPVDLTFGHEPPPTLPPVENKPEQRTWGKSLLEQADEIQLSSPKSSPAPAAATRISSPVRQRSSNPLAIFLSLLALGAAAAVGYAQWKTHTPSWEDQNRAKIISLHAQGQVLADVGKIPEALARYNELSRLISGHIIHDPELKREIEDAGREQASAASITIDSWEDEHRLPLMLLRSQGEVLLLAGKYPQAMEKFDQLLRIARQHRSLSSDLAEQVRLAQAGLQEAQQKLDEEKRAAIAPPKPAPIHTPRPVVSNPPQTVEHPPENVKPVKPNIFDQPPPTTRRSVFD